MWGSLDADVETRYERAKNDESDINEHIETLYEYTKECESVIELGVRGIVSSWAFLKGLINNQKQHRRLLSCDLNRPSNIDDLALLSKRSNVLFEFHEGNDLDLDLLDKRFDLLFIDTFHVYGQMKRELQKFAASINKYIIMHDTTVDAFNGECIRMGYDVEKLSVETNIPREELLMGIMPAIYEFLQQNHHWIIHEIKENNNGLLVLKRISF